MRMASVIFVLTGASGLFWMSQQFMKGNFGLWSPLAVLVPIAVLYQAWQLWTNQPSARKSGLATAIVLALICAAQLALIAWQAAIPVTEIATSPLRATLLSLWGGLVLYATAAMALAFNAVRPNKSLERSRDR
jgi:hypothetical protein